MKTLYVNGCSFSQGRAYLINPLEERYGTHLAQYLQMDVVSQAQAGGSNSRLVRTTLDFFINKICNGEPIDDFVAVIQFTNDGRYELYDETIKSYEGHSGWWDVGINGQVYDDGIWTNEEVDKQHTRFEFYSDEQNVAKILRNIITLGEFFKSNNIKYMFTGITNMFGPEQTAHEEGANAYIYAKHSYNWFNGDPKQCGMTEVPGFIQFSRLDPHPSAETHALYATLFFKRLVELYPELKPSGQNHR